LLGNPNVLKQRQTLLKLIRAKKDLCTDSTISCDEKLFMAGNYERAFSEQHNISFFVYLLMLVYFVSTETQVILEKKWKR